MAGFARHYAREIRWHQLWPLAKPMGLAHHIERGFDAEDYSVDAIEMQTLEFMNKLRIIAGYEDELAKPTLVGYLIWYLGAQFGASGIKLAKMGPWYIEPRLRHSGIAMAMREASWEALRASGVRRALWNSMPNDCGGWLRRLDATPYETSWLLEIPR